MLIQQVQIAGIGIGPSNLSLAALLEPISQISSLFLDKQKSFSWHTGMELPGAQLQVSYLKDLVTLVDPKNEFSFLSYLSSQKRLYQFINANFQHISRAEFSQYYSWVCEILSSKMKFNAEVEELHYVKNKFFLKSNKCAVMSDSIVLGNGLTPRIPDFVRAPLDYTLFHSSNFMKIKNDYKDKEIVVVGGGQSGAEIIYSLLNSKKDRPLKLTWVTRRDNYLPLDDSPFINELFTPVYSDYFYSLSQKSKTETLNKQKLFSDGISKNTLTEIYKLLYQIRFVEKQKNVFDLKIETEINKVVKNNKTWTLNLTSKQEQKKSVVHADIVILCTGYEYQLPKYLNPILKLINRDSCGNLIVNKDYSLSTDLPNSSKIYIQNGAAHARGISDPNLSLSAWRSAIIANSIAGKEFYDLEGYESFINWSGAEENLSIMQDQRVIKKVIRNYG